MNWYPNPTQLLGLNLNGYTNLTLQSHMAQRGLNLPFQLNQFQGNCLIRISITGDSETKSPSQAKYFILSLIGESLKTIQHAGPSPSAIFGKIKSAALHQLLYVPVLWIFLACALGDGHKKLHIFFVQDGIFSLILAYAILNLQRYII